MGNAPSEANGVTCTCGRSLPPCKDWDGFVLKSIDRMVDRVNAYEFLGGRYYRIQGWSIYYCPDCFWRPKREYLQKQEEERKRREERERRRREEIARQKEEARRREIARQQEEERRRLQEQKRQEELRRRQEEERREAARREALLQQEEQNAEKFEEWTLNGGNEEEEFVRTETYKPFTATEKSYQQLYYYDSSYYEDLLSEDVILSEEEVQEVTTVSTELVSSVSFSLDLLSVNEELSNEWLRSAQILLLTYYLQSKNFTQLETDLLLDFLACLQLDLSDKECLSLAKTFHSLVETHPSDFTMTFKLDASLPLPAKLASLLLQSGRIFNENNLWMQRCLHTLASAMTEDKQLQNTFLEITCKNWSSYDWLRLFQRCTAAQLPANTQKHILHLIQTYCLQPVFVKGVLKSDPKNAIVAFTEQIENEQNKSLVELFDEIRETKFISEELLCQVEKIAKRVYDILEEKDIDIKLDHDKHIKSTMNETVTIFKRLSDKDALVDDDDIANAIITLMCAVEKVKPFYPRKTQIVSLLLLLLSSKNQSNRLLEVMTGEGKSCIVALFATVLGIQGKNVDVITSSPILAVRDAEEWAAFYHVFNLKVTHNTDLERSKDANVDEVKRECYKHHIVYGTIGNFAADILREEFEQKRIRSGRRFDAVIVDEVDMLMLDEGVQFTYLSHSAAILRHMEPVLSAVWGLIGTLRMSMTVNGKVLYAGNPKLFTETIFECLDPELCKCEHPEQVLATAKELGVITFEQFQKLTNEDQEIKKAAISQLQKSDALTLLSGLEDYENMPEFQAYVVNKDGLLEAVTSVTSEETAEKLLLLDYGLACILNTKNDVKERATAIIKSKLQFSDDVGDAKVKLPKFLKEFVMDQVPIYVENAIRALHMEEDREYAISRGKIIPVDFQNSGVMELNKKWGGGLQQMLEMKHHLSISSMSLVTNFMSNVEFFSRFKREGGIYGMSGTLGLDSHSNTSKILSDLYDVKVCSIPTFKVRKLFEKAAVIVENSEQWFREIIKTVESESKEEGTWKKGRATLILCQDIKSAEDLRDYVIKKAGWKEESVYLYAHSNSKQLSHIKKKMGPGEVVIATNLAGRGTNIKVKDEVNDSGGLLCLVTFLARNRRVELQAFGRTARSGRPGSVRCILNASSMPTHYEGLNIQAIRKLRAEEELIRLNQLINSDVKEVQLREALFKKHCMFLQQIHQEFEGRDDLPVVVSSMNENWGQWLQMKSKQIDLLEEVQLVHDLSQAQLKWKPAVPSEASSIVQLPVTNFYHLIQFGNQFLVEDDKENAKKALKYYDESIRMEPRYALIAYYNRAYCSITAEVDDYKRKSLEDIRSALACLEHYVDEVSSVYQCVSLVRQVRKISEREVEDQDSEEDYIGDFNMQVQARYEIFRFLREKLEEAIRKMEQLKDSGDDFIAKPVGIFSLIPGADYTTNLELTSVWTLGLEIVYSIEKKPKFCWSGLACFLLGVAQIVGGVLLTVFTVGTAASIGMGLISEGISDCISGIEGMVTGEFDWKEWAIAKATGLAISLISGGVSRLATSGFKALKVGYKIASKVGRQLKAIPKIARSSFGSAAKTNLKTASKYIAKEAVLQGVSYAQNKLFDVAFEKLATLIGKKCKESFMTTIRAAFFEGYLGKVVNQRYIALLDESFSTRSEVSKFMQSKAEAFFSDLGDAVVNKLVSDSTIKQQLTSASLSLFEQISEKSPKGGKVAFIANLAEMAVMETIAVDTVKKLDFLVARFAPEMEAVCKKFITEEGITVQPDAGAKYQNYECTRKLKSDLADHVGDAFGSAVSTLLQGNLGPMINHTLNRSVGRLSHRVLDKYVVKSDKTLEDLTAGQHANYIRSVGADLSDHGTTNIAVVGVYAKYVEDSDSAGSLMDLRIASEHFGQGVTIYQEKKGKLIKDCSIDPAIKKKDSNIELIYIPPQDGNSVGHYDVLIGGKRVRVEAEKSNCLFHAYALGQNPSLTDIQLSQEAHTLRQVVVTSIRDEPHKWGEHITLRVQMDHLRRGNLFVLIGAGPPNVKTKVIKDFYAEKAVGNEVYTMYEQENGIKCKAVRTYDKPLKVVKDVATTPDVKLKMIKTHMDGLSLTDNAGRRCWATKPVTGMIKRYKGKAEDSEVSFHLCPSRGGANAGDEYANAVMTSTDYNEQEKAIWTPAVKDCIGNEKFSMTVEGKCEDLVQDYKGGRPFDQKTKKRLKRRLEMVVAKEPKAYRMEETKFTIYLPSKTKQSHLDDIEKTSKVEVKTDMKTKTATFTLPADTELFVPKDVSKLDKNGELHPKEISSAKKKQPELKIGMQPRYKHTPTVSKNFKVKHDAFKKNFDEFQKKGFNH